MKYVTVNRIEDIKNNKQRYGMLMQRHIQLLDTMKKAGEYTKKRPIADIPKVYNTTDDVRMYLRGYDNAMMVMQEILEEEYRGKSKDIYNHEDIWSWNEEE